MVWSVNSLISCGLLSRTMSPGLLWAAYFSAPAAVFSARTARPSSGTRRFGRSTAPAPATPWRGRRLEKLAAALMATGASGARFACSRACRGAGAGRGAGAARPALAPHPPSAQRALAAQHRRDTIAFAAGSASRALSPHKSPGLAEERGGLFWPLMEGGRAGPLSRGSRGRVTRWCWSPRTRAPGRSARG
jgi:hypothetical protein